MGVIVAIAKAEITRAFGLGQGLLEIGTRKYSQFLPCKASLDTQFAAYTL